MILLSVTAAAAERAPILAELFTSEGCSSCPPADALLQRLDADVIVLSEHVDYWNRLGWRDPFSSPEFTVRQQGYAQRLGKEVYTPQLVIDGREAMVGSDVAAVKSALERAGRARKVAVRLSVSRDGDTAAISISIDPLAKGHAEVWIAAAYDTRSSDVTRGENAGRKLVHVAVVRSLTKAGAINASKGLDKTVRVPVGSMPARVVAFVAEPDGAIAGTSLALLP